jgi:hypothetical protein
MELLLNLFWLMLALPAVLIWRHDLTSARPLGMFSRSRSFVLLSCLLALLFPIVSATDDLHPIRAEIEESSPSKRVVKQAPGPNSPTWSSASRPPEQLLDAIFFRVKDETIGLVSIEQPIFLDQALASTIGSRGPPVL